MFLNHKKVTINAIRQAASVNLFVSLSNRSGSDPYIHMETAAVTPLPRKGRHPVADPIGHGDHDNGNQKVLADDFPGPLTLHLRDDIA